MAVRILLRSPGLAAIAVLSLALGIGASITVFSVVREMKVDDLSAERPDRLARLNGEVESTLYRDHRR